MLSAVSRQLRVLYAVKRQLTGLSAVRRQLTVRGHCSLTWVREDDDGRVVRDHIKVDSDPIVLIDGSSPHIYDVHTSSGSIRTSQ